MSIATSRDPAPPGQPPRLPARAARPAPAGGDDPASWREMAACRASDPELFFPVSATGRSLPQIRAAKAVCARCPVRLTCLVYALTTGQDFGIWGGHDEQERRRLRQRWTGAGRQAG